MRIENWAVVSPSFSPTQAPETVKLSLQGNVFGHPRFENGRNIFTSSIKHKTGDGLVVTSSGSEYELGEPNPEYEVMFPNAKERLLDNLTE